MSGVSAGRIRKEIADITNDKLSRVSIQQDPTNPMHLTGTIKGPDDTPYAGGTFVVDITIPNEYPFSPPKMKFLTKVWHPNVSSVTGAICLDILKDQWSPALTMKTALLSLQALLCSPEPNDPQDAVVATMYKERFSEFVQTAREWTAQHANGVPTPVVIEIPAPVRRLMEMGFPEDACRSALSRAKGDENAAVEILLGGM